MTNYEYEPHLYDIKAIRDHMNEVHGGYCDDADVYVEEVNEIETPHGIQLEVKAECQHCMSGTFSVLSDRKEFHVKKQKPVRKRRPVA